ncbi:MAG TPA: Ig-like domain-containing protein [Solirubrobacteraceae bacterium]|jgi:predicted phage tail protein
MGRRAALWLVLPVLGLVAACAFAATAGAYTYVVRPNTTISAGSWTVVPSGTIDSVLDDNVLSPAAPSTASDYVEENGNGPVTFEVGLGDVALRSGENVTSVRSWGYATTGDARTIDVDLRHGTTVLASGSWPAGAPAQWQSLTYTGSLTQLEVNDLRQHRTIQGNGASTATRVYAAYAEVHTDMAAPAPAITAGPGVAGQSANPSWSFTASPAASLQCRLEDGGGGVVSDWAACTSPTSYDLSGPGDGAYTFKVRALDDVGNPGPETAATYTLDRVAPAAPALTSMPPDPSNNSIALWTFTSEGGGTLDSCRLERGATVVSDWALCSSPHSYNLTSESDGAYTLRIRSTDMAGNQSTETTDGFTLDRGAPAAPTITSAPPAAGNGSNPSWSFTYEAGATASCRLERGATVVSDWSACTSPRGFDLGSEADGVYTFRVRATDAAGNTGAEASGTYDMDHSAPAAPTITGGPTGDSQDQTPQFSFTAEAGSTKACRLERGATVVSDWASCNSPKSYTLNAQPDGTYTFRVRATDAAGNTGPDATRSYNLDRTAPAAPTITGGPPASSADAAPSFSFTHEAGATAECKVMRGATTVFAWAPCSSPKGYDLTAEVDATYVFHVRATDAAGNLGPEATRSYTLDRVEPVAPTITGRPNAVTNDDTPTWTFTASFDVVKYRCHLDRGATVVYAYAVCTSPHTYDLTALPDGTYTFGVRGSDDAANESTETSDTFTLDRSPPAAPTITGGPAGDSRDAMPSYTFTAEAGASTECRIERPGFVVSDWGPCVSPRSYDLTLQSDATYTFSVRATDAAGNTGATATRVYNLDRTAPAAPVITGGPAADSNDDTPVYSFTGEAGASFACRLERGATAVSDWAPCSTPVGYDLSGEADGAYTFRVRATDAAGNTSADRTRAYALDRVPPPAPSLTSTPGADTNDATPTWAFTAAAGTTTECRLERGATVVSGWASCASPRTYDLSGEVDGSYTFRVRAIDAAGNTGAETADATALDRIAPAAPAITGGPVADTADPTPAFTFTYEAGASASCRIERGATVVSDWASCASPKGYDLSSEPDGAYTFRVRATDAAQNTGAEATRSFTLDRVAPNQPSISVRPPASTNDDTPTYDWSGDAGSTDNCWIERGATVVVDWTSCSPPRTFDLSGEPDGTYTFRVRSSDPAGNVSTEANDTFALDRDSPSSPTVTSGPAADSADDTPAFGFTAEGGSTTECRIERGAAVVDDWSACTSPKAYDLSAEADGSYTFHVRATDAAGNTGPAGTRSYTLDRVAPAAPSITSGPAADSQDDTPAFGWTAEAGATSECRVERGAAVVSDWAACTSPKTFDLSGEADGAYTFRVRASDAAGNTGPDASRAYTLDRTAPPAPAITSAPAADSTDDSPTYAFTAEAGAALECRLQRGATVVDDWAACTSPRTYDVTAEPDGVYTFRVRATDAAGNTGADASDTYTLDRTVPFSPVLDARPGDDGNDRTPEWAFSTVELNRTFECRLTRDATVLEDWGPCVSPRQYDLSLEADATYTFAVRAANAAGTRSVPLTDDYALDTAAPAAPVASGGPAADSTDDTPAWDVAAEPGAALECRLERGASVVSDWSACSSPVGFDLRAEPDGTYTFLTRAIDAAGNTGAAGSVSYTLDRTVPSDPALGTNPPAAGSDATPTWEFTGEAGTSFECRVTQGATVVDDWTACTSPYTPDLTSRPDGTYTIEIRSVNAAGTRGPVTSDDYDLDRGAPAAPVIVSGPAGDSSDDTPTWSFTGEATSTFECRVERGATVVSDWAPCTDPETANLNAEPDGPHTFRVRQTDPAGNVSPDASSAYNLDRTVPGAPSIDGGPSTPGADRTPEWTVSGAGGLTLECRLTRGADVVSGWAVCSSPVGFDLQAEPDGAYTFHVRQFNAAGTRGPEATGDYVLDVTAPAAPAIISAPGAVGNGSSPAWSFTAEAGASVECRLQRGGADVRPWAPCTSPRSFGLAGEPDGDYTFSVRATDAAGNTGPAATDAHRVDRVPPAPPAIGDDPGPLGRGRTPSWGFTAEDGATFECTLERAGATLDPWAVCVSPRGYDLAGQDDGPFAFAVRAVDAAGNTSPASTSPYVLDTTPGAATIEGGPGPIGRDRAPRWRFAGEEGASFECRLSLRDVPVADWGPCVSPHGFDLTGRPDGTFAFALRATDPAGNVGPAGEAAYELDTTPPDAPLIDRRPDTPGTDRTPSWRFSGEENATFSCRVEREPAGTVLDWTLCASPFTADLAREDDGSYRFLVRATDVAGNTGESAAGDYELTSPEQPRDETDDTGDPPREDGPPPSTTPSKARPKTQAAPPAAPQPERKKRRQKPKNQPEEPNDDETPAAAAPKPEPPEEEDDGGNFATDAVKDAVKAIAQNPDKSVFPLSLLLLVLAFLSIQNRIDRSDPKLALAPTFADPDLEFRPSPGDNE